MKNAKLMVAKTDYILNHWLHLIYISSQHGDHFHVVHDRFFSRNSCRYLHIKNINEKFTRLQQLIVRSGEWNIGNRINTESISQSIYKRVHEKLITYKSPEEIGDVVVKLEIFPYSRDEQLDKKNWWKTANIITTFITIENAVLHKLILQLEERIQEYFSRIFGLSKDTKETSYSSGYNNFKRRH